MTREEAKGFIQGKLDCMDRCGVFDCKGTDECENCVYCYSQGNFGEQKKALEMAIESLGNDTNVGSKWIPCSERLPSDTAIHEVTAQFRNGTIYTEFAYYDEAREEWWKFDDDGIVNVIAWKEQSQPYKGE